MNQAILSAMIIYDPKLGLKNRDQTTWVIKTENASFEKTCRKKNKMRPQLINLKKIHHRFRNSGNKKQLPFKKTV